ncbi:SMP-30/gluconolactonase/LRE family protein [Sphingomonas sp. CGMCC 1.13654]|uniref:SMP-30/gluconolactonase/LRE family protein n=1 Tax=Sphingomonas chungangi TaxID=2683589 RepID=A0A838L806_9SPHN|nr:SMP-30/gluconolactonase/LRE family protein [Sphingomonas chungangi]MBA2933678.1 SMP-30/gluconolactonase/LRE family protein [Sphingomonas chungangi]MVW55010.1 SMP-30/gluconolactonase/LRE family protein [Sphingomonas chungangi]
MRFLTDGLMLPEGPIALADGSLMVVEVLGGRLTRIAPDGARSVVAELGGGPNGAAIGPDGRCYVCNNGGLDHIELEGGALVPQEAPIDTPPGSIQVVDLATGAFEMLYAHGEATPFWGPNDIVFDRDGGFWFTDFGRDRGRVRMRGAVYYARADGSGIREVIAPIDAPNGIGLSPDGRTLYVATTYEAHLLSFRLSAPGVVDRSAGQMPGGATIVGRAGAGQYLDSLAIDRQGRICVASPGIGAILVFPAGGGAPMAIDMPDFLTTNICFGGADLTTAYVTLGSSGRVAMLDWDTPGLPLAF